jgi:hypothetical protein
MTVHYHPCTACTVLPTLDLKFVIHDGSFILQQVAGHDRLLGPAVNLVHRLLKNSVTQRTGKRAYAFVTDTAVSRLQIPAGTGLAHEEHYPDVGVVSGIVIDVVGLSETDVPSPAAG